MSGADKRRFPRVYFSMDGVLAAEVNKGAEAVVGQVLNVSVGGLQFSFKRASGAGFAEGEQLVLSSIADDNGLGILAGVGLEVRWVLDHDFLDHVAVGCEFKNLAADQQDSLQQMVDNHLQ